MAKKSIKELVDNSSRSCFQIGKEWYAFKKGIKSFLYGGEASAPVPTQVEDALKDKECLKYLVDNKSELVELITEESLIEELTESQILSEENEALKDKNAKLEAELEALKAGKQ